MGFSMSFLWVMGYGVEWEGLHKLEVMDKS